MSQHLLGTVNALPHGKYAPETLLVVGTQGSVMRLSYRPTGWNRVQGMNGKWYRMTDDSGSQLHQLAEWSDQEFAASVVFDSPAPMFSFTDLNPTQPAAVPGSGGSPASERP